MRLRIKSHAQPYMEIKVVNDCGGLDGCAGEIWLTSIESGRPPLFIHLDYYETMAVRDACNDMMDEFQEKLRKP